MGAEAAKAQRGGDKSISKFIKDQINQGKLFRLPCNFVKQSPLWFFAEEIYFPFQAQLWPINGLERIICRICSSCLSSKYSNFLKHIRKSHKQLIIDEGSFTAYHCYCAAEKITIKDLLAEKFNPQMDYNKLTDDERDDVIKNRKMMKLVARSKKGQGTERCWKITAEQIKRNARSVSKKTIPIHTELFLLKEVVQDDFERVQHGFDMRMAAFKCGSNLSNHSIEFNRCIAEHLSVKFFVSNSSEKYSQLLYAYNT